MLAFSSVREDVSLHDVTRDLERLSNEAEGRRPAGPGRHGAEGAAGARARDRSRRPGDRARRAVGGAGRLRRDRGRAGRDGAGTDAAGAGARSSRPPTSTISPKTTRCARSSSRKRARSSPKRQAAYQELARSPDELSLLTTLRRAFHTLKGSSRMVGLKDFGEAAWICEQLYNTHLAEQRTAGPAFIEFTGWSLGYLGAWSEEIAARTPISHDVATVKAQADRLAQRLGAAETESVGHLAAARPAAESAERATISIWVRWASTPRSCRRSIRPRMTTATRAPDVLAFELDLAAFESGAAPAPAPEARPSVSMGEVTQVLSNDQLAAPAGSDVAPSFELDLGDRAGGRAVFARSDAEPRAGGRRCRTRSAIGGGRLAEVESVAAPTVAPESVSDDGVDACGERRRRTDEGGRSAADRHSALQHLPERSRRAVAPPCRPSSRSGRWSCTGRSATCRSRWRIRSRAARPRSGSPTCRIWLGRSNTALTRSHALRHGTPDEAQLFTEVADDIRRLLHQFAAGFLKEPAAGLLRAARRTRGQLGPAPRRAERGRRIAGQRGRGGCRLRSKRRAFIATAASRRSPRRLGPAAGPCGSRRLRGPIVDETFAHAAVHEPVEATSTRQVWHARRGRCALVLRLSAVSTRGGPDDLDRASDFIEPDDDGDESAGRRVRRASRGAPCSARWTARAPASARFDGPRSAFGAFDAQRSAFGALQARFDPLGVSELKPLTALATGRRARPAPAAESADDAEDDIDAQDAVDAELFPIFEEEALELIPRLATQLRDLGARARRVGERIGLHAHPAHAEGRRPARRCDAPRRDGAPPRDPHRAHPGASAGFGRRPRGARRSLRQPGACPRSARRSRGRCRGSDSDRAVPRRPRRSSSVRRQRRPSRRRHPARPSPSVPPEPHAEQAAPNRCVEPAAPVGGAAGGRRGTCRDRPNRPRSTGRASSRPSRCAPRRRIAVRPPSQAAVRVGAPLLDRLVNQAGEVSITRSRVEVECRPDQDLARRPDREPGAPARPAARHRDPGRDADDLAHRGGQGRGRELRPARVRPLHALPGADADDGRVGQRRRHGAAHPAALARNRPRTSWSRRRA